MVDAAPVSSDTDQVQALLIADQASDRMFFESAFRNCGEAAALCSAANAAQARQQLEAEPAPDVLFVDGHLPGPPVEELLEWVRSRPKFERVLVVAVTGDFGRACLRPNILGAHAVLVKPIAKMDVAAFVALARAMRARPARAEAVPAN